MQRLPLRQFSLTSAPLAGCAALRAWAVALFFRPAAVLAALAQAIIRRQDPVTRYLSRRRPLASRRRPLAGPRPGAELPG